jgi:hypothetical protein
LAYGRSTFRDFALSGPLGPCSSFWPLGSATIAPKRHYTRSFILCDKESVRWAVQEQRS